MKVENRVFVTKKWNGKNKWQRRNKSEKSKRLNKKSPYLVSSPEASSWTTSIIQNSVKCKNWVHWAMNANKNFRKYSPFHFYFFFTAGSVFSSILIQNEPWMSQWQSEHEIEPDSKSEPEWAGNAKHWITVLFVATFPLRAKSPKMKYLRGEPTPQFIQHCI